MNLKILVCCHKDDIKAENEYYLPIHVGKKNSNQELNITGDNTGNNISDKNSSYCELTGMYWAWKNLKNLDYIGLCHYRRYFKFEGSYFSSPSKKVEIKQFNELQFNISDAVKSSLEKGNLIVPKSESLRLSLYTDYCIWHYSEDLRTLEKILKNYGIKYSDAFNKIMYHNNELYPYNMFIMSWKEYDKYCTWLFDVLSEAESQIDISQYNIYQKRIFGFMAERLFNIYIEANNLNLDEHQVLFITNDKHNTLPYPLYKIKKIINKFASRYVSPPQRLFVNK